jgi:LysM repeat protein
MCTQKQIALKLLVGILFVFMSACGQQSSQDVFTQINARLDQLEQKITKLDAKDAELTELVNDGKAGTIKLEENMAALAQQVEKIAARPSGPAARKPAQPSAVVPAEKKHHIVARGETLYSIARRYGRSVDELRRLNNLSQSQPIQAGQKLVVAQ